MNTSLFLRLRNTFFIFIIFFFSFVSFAQDAGFNEVFDEDGFIKPQYRKVMKVYQNLSDDEIKRLEKKFLKDFLDDNTLLTVPRVLTLDEFNELKKGVEQRGKALHAFLRDHYSGQKNYLKDKVIPKEVIDRIIDRYGEKNFEGFMNPDQIRFWYGPDIIRDKNGNWRVIEDNPGYVGLFGDLEISKKILEERIPEYKKIKNLSNPEKFYKNLVERYKKQAQGKKVVSLHYNALQTADNETIRLKEIFSRYGVVDISLDDINPKNTNYLEKWLEVNKEGVFLVRVDKKGNQVKEEVGFIINEIEPKDLDSDHFVFKNKKLKQKKNYFSLLDAVMENKVKVSSIAGCEFIGDKEFYVYVEDLIRYYLKEEPILKNLETQKFLMFNKTKFVFDKNFFNEVFNNIENYVVKAVDGRGGEQVYIGNKMTESEVKKLMDKVLENPQIYIVQKFTPLSQLNGYLVDLRLPADVGSEGVFVGRAVAGRSVPIHGGDGKVNLSQNGKETAVWIVPLSKKETLEFNCSKKLKKEYKKNHI